MRLKGSLGATEVSFGSWACGVTAAQDPVKVRVRVRIPPGPPSFGKIVSQGQVEGAQDGVRPSLK
jgi:hypothetical protein